MRDGIFTADAHAHIFGRPTVIGGRLARFSAGDLVHQMDRHGVDLSLVIARPTEPCTGNGLADLHNELASAAQPYGQRLALGAWASPRFGRAGADELDRCIRQLDFRAIKLHPEQEQFALDDGTADPSVRVAAEHGVPVIAHTALAVRGAEPWRLLRLASKFPSVTFVMAHLGGDGGMLQSMGAVEIAAQVNNIVVEGSATVTDPSATYGEPARLLGPERVLYGSNEPIHQMALSLLKLDLVEMPAGWRRLIAGENLVRLLRLEAALGVASDQEAMPA